MDYLDELDDSAIQALAELGGGLDLKPVSASAIMKKTLPSSRLQRRRRIEATYLLRLEDPLYCPRNIATILGAPRVPTVEVGQGKTGSARFCRLPQSQINALDLWMASHHPHKKLTKIRLGIAHKDAHELPMLGRDPTLPHHRPSSDANQSVSEPPVCYFFYGTLASPERLSRLFGIPMLQLESLEAATLLDGRVQTWAGKYWALVDCAGGKVEGFAYPVVSEDQEDALRVYEGDSYEVVRARIVCRGEEMEARTFRFCGYEDELSG